MSTHSQFSGVIGIYGRLFRSPAAVVFLIIFLVLYMVMFYLFIGKRDIDVIELAKSLPLAVSALILGFFSVLFWALNYVGRQQKIELEIKKSEALFNIRTKAIENLFQNVSNSESVDLVVLKAHLLLNGGELKSNPEVPEGEIGLTYSDAVKSVLRRG